MKSPACRLDACGALERPSMGWGYGYERGQRAYNMDREYKQEFYRGPCKD